MAMNGDFCMAVSLFCIIKNLVAILQPDYLCPSTSFFYVILHRLCFSCFCWGGVSWFTFFSCAFSVYFSLQRSIADRNRSSPKPITNLYKGLTRDQRSAIASMGQGSFMDIKCDNLHNPLISWFVWCYDPARRGFVIPCRGFIPLTEESVQLNTGIPRGTLEVKYDVDYEYEEEMSSILFPGESSRPKTSAVGTRIAQYKQADVIFKQLWMVHTVSTMLAPTLDIKISNKCYPMLVYFHAPQVFLSHLFCFFIF